jgi:hypothetical protein
MVSRMEEEVVVVVDVVVVVGNTAFPDQLEPKFKAARYS